MSGLINKKILKVEQQVVAQPHSREAEEAILGCILLKSELFGEVKEFIPKTEVFYFDSSQIVWNKMKELAGEHVEIEPISVISKLNKEEKNKVTAYYLTGLCNDIATTATVINYATIILEKYLQRELIKATYKIQKSAFENNTEFESLLKFIKKTTDELTSLTPSKDPTLDQIINQTIESIETSGNYVKFGFKKLDNLAGGMTKGEITVIAGRPSHGKTTFAVNLIKNFFDKIKPTLMEIKDVVVKKFKSFIDDITLPQHSQSLSFSSAHLSFDDSRPISSYFSKALISEC